MYRQITVDGLGRANTTDPGAYTVAYRSVLADWRDFITDYDHGHPIIFIGHSQGSLMLIRLLRAQRGHESDRSEADGAGHHRRRERHRTDRPDGGSHLRAPPAVHRHRTRAAASIAYSSFPSEPPANANFGRPGQGISLNAGQTATTGVQVACVNPAAIGGGPAYLKTYWPVTAPLPIPSMAPSPPPVSTPWLYYPKQYTGTCATEDGATLAPGHRHRRCEVGYPTAGQRDRRPHLGLPLPGHQSGSRKPGRRRGPGRVGVPLAPERP